MGDLQKRLAEMPEEQRHFTLLHLGYHLSAAGMHDALYQLIDATWRDAHFLHTGASTSFAADVTLALEAAAARFPADFAQCWRCSVIASALSEIDTQVSPPACGLAASLGRDAEAVALADATRPPGDRCRAHLRIADVFIGQGRIGEAGVQIRKAAEAA